MKVEETTAIRNGIPATEIQGEPRDTRSGTMNVLIEAMNTIGLDPLHLDIGELTGIHDMLRPLLDQCVLGDNNTAMFQLVDGLHEAKQRRFNYHSVQAVFSY